ncbi:MAG: PH domain-containing protein [Phycisphaerae bacterium]|nr:PH domain-containing protein [Phycisphaerae bacterium]MDW8261953.1 PH domain-containing protein [Phycisphaerales bacterium]
MAAPEYLSASSPFDPASIERPDPSLLTYYLLISALTLFGFPFVFLPYLCKYYTLRYKFDDQGVSMSWGVLFHRQVYLTYRRIQDIHVTRNLLHRWLGLAAVAVQTAAGSASAEMVIEGIRNPEALRDFLYSRMRGARPEHPADYTTSQASAEAARAPEPSDEALQLLRDIRDGIRGLRARVDRLEQQR